MRSERAASVERWAAKAPATNDRLPAMLAAQKNSKWVIES
jgi:hypothetical protein